MSYQPISVRRIRVPVGRIGITWKMLSEDIPTFLPAQSSTSEWLEREFRVYLAYLLTNEFRVHLGNQEAVLVMREDCSWSRHSFLECVVGCIVCVSHSVHGHLDDIVTVRLNFGSSLSWRQAR